MIQDEVNVFSPKFDLNFRNNCQSCLEDLKKTEIGIDRENFRKGQSPTEKLEYRYFNSQLHQRYFWTKAQLEQIKRTHLYFLETEFVNILRIICNPNIIEFLYKENEDILNEQTEIDKKTN